MLRADKNAARTAARDASVKIQRLYSYRPDRVQLLWIQGLQILRDRKGESPWFQKR